MECFERFETLKATSPLMHTVIKTSTRNANIHSQIYNHEYVYSIYVHTYIRIYIHVCIYCGNHEYTYTCMCECKEDHVGYVMNRTYRLVERSSLLRKKSKKDILYANDGRFRIA